MSTTAQSTPPAPDVPEPSYPRSRVERTANEAADEVLAAIDAPEQGVRDAVNLVVNALLSRLDTPGMSLDEVIESNYSADPDTVLGWASAF